MAATLPVPAGWLLKGLPEGCFDTFVKTARPDLFRPRRDRKKLRIANFITLSGPAGIWGPAGTNSTLLAATEINRRGGILGREIELVFHDAGGNIDNLLRSPSHTLPPDAPHTLISSHTTAATAP